MDFNDFGVGLSLIALCAGCVALAVYAARQHWKIDTLHERTESQGAQLDAQAAQLTSQDARLTEQATKIDGLQGRLENQERARGKLYSENLEDVSFTAMSVRRRLEFMLGNRKDK